MNSIDELIHAAYRLGIVAAAKYNQFDDMTYKSQWQMHWTVDLAKAELESRKQMLLNEITNENKQPT